MVRQQALHFMVVVKCIDACGYELGWWYFGLCAKMLFNWCVCVSDWKTRFWMRFIKFPKTHALPGNLMNSLETLCRNARASLYCSRILVPWMLWVFSIEFPQTHPRPRNVWSRLETFCRIARASLCCSRMFVPWSLLIFYIEFPQTQPCPRICMKQWENWSNSWENSEWIWFKMLRNSSAVLSRCAANAQAFVDSVALCGV